MCVIVLENERERESLTEWIEMFRKCISIQWAVEVGPKLQ